MFEAGEEIDDLMALCRADITSKNERRVKQYLRNFDRVEKKIVEVEEKDRIRNWKNPISGDEIMEIMNVKPGPVIGKVKDRIKDAIMDGEIPNNHEEAYKYLMKIKNNFK